jgi:hypothetical protein
MSGYRLVPQPADLSREELRALIEKNGFDHVLVSRSLGTRQETEVIPGAPDPYFGGFYGYYGYTAPLLYHSTYVETQTFAESDNRLYRTDGPADLVWTGSSETRVGGDTEKTLASLSDAIVDRLEEKNLL